METRLASFTELVGTAIANSEAHEQLAQLADAQAALRRVATVVAEGAPPDRVFDAVRDEVARMFNAPLSVLMRYDANGIATVLATADGYLGPVGRTWQVDGDGSAIARVCQTGRPARIDYTEPVDGSIADAARSAGARSAVGVPVVVKESYFPNWQVHGADGPYRLAPNLMVVIPRQHDVSLTYGLTPVDWLGRILTLAGLAGLVLLVRWKGARKYCAFPPDSSRPDSSTDGPPPSPDTGESPGGDEPPPSRWSEPAPALP